MRPLDTSVLPHLRPASTPLSVVVASGVVSGVLTVVQAFALGALVVAAVSDPSGEAWHDPAWLLLGTLGARALVTWAGQVAASHAAGIVSTHLRLRLMTAARTRHDTVDVNGLTVLATRGAAGIEPYVTRYLPALVPALVLPVVTVGAIWWLDWLSGLIVVLTLPLVPAFAILVGLTTKEKADRQWRLMNVLAGHFLDVVRGLPTLVAHRRAAQQVGTIRSVTHRYRQATVDTLKLAFASSTVLELVATLSVALVAVAVGLRLAAGGIDFRIALTVLLLAPEAYWPLRRVGAEFHSAAEGAAALGEADEFLAAAPSDTCGTLRPSTTRLVLRDLEVGYADGPSLVTPLSVELPHRGLLAITGPSGCGKSTLLATLRGELPARAGEVRVGGHGLDEVDPDWWRAQVAWAPQRPWLVAGSVADNVRLGRPDASDDDVWAALRAVALDDAVEALPQGMNSPLGEDGSGLSAGQRARVALARIVLAQRPVVLLDEPSAHLDEVTERVLLETIAGLARTSLVIVVAHRAAVAQAADTEIALDPRLDATTARRVLDLRAPHLPRPVDPAVVDSDGRWWGLPVATLLDALSTASGVALTATAGWLITRASEHPPVLYLMVAIVGVRLFGLARPVLRHAERVLSHDVVLRQLAERRAQVYADLVPLVPGRLGPRRGDLLTQVVDDVDAELDHQLRVRQPLAAALLVGAAAVATAAVLDPAAAAVVLGVALSGPLAFALGRSWGSSTEPQVVLARAALGIRAEETVQGLRELQQWQAADRAIDDVEACSSALARSQRRSVAVAATSHAITTCATGAGVIAMAALVTTTSVSPAMLALLLLLPLALDDAAGPLADAGVLSVRTGAARERLRALSTMQPAVSDPASPTRLPPSHDVRLDRVTLGWDAHPELQHLDLHVRQGEHLGVVGASGTGKSTLAATLMRFIDPQAGRVLLGEVDARELALDDVRTVVGLVDDDPHVFASTLVENVRFARPGATEDEVVAALQRAGLGDWIATLPHGPHTLVGAGHREVSGGERARIAIARAVLAGSPVLVLDEPTAHLDSSTARRVSTGLLDAAEAAGRTVVWITHGTVGLDRMDRVIRLHDQPVVVQEVRRPGVREQAAARA